MSDAGNFFAMGGANSKLCDRKSVTPLMRAIMGGCDELALTFIRSSRVDVNKECEIGTPLIFAIDQRRADLIESLLKEGGGDPNKRFQGRTPLFYAKAEAHKRKGGEIVVAMLEDAGAEEDPIFIPFPGDLERAKLTVAEVIT
jgi:ankyrin repeat protein